jgi:hypothetical protein
MSTSLFDTFGGPAAGELGSAPQVMVVSKDYFHRGGPPAPHAAALRSPRAARPFMMRNSEPEESTRRRGRVLHVNVLDRHEDDEQQDPAGDGGEDACAASARPDIIMDTGVDDYGALFADSAFLDDDPLADGSAFPDNGHRVCPAADVGIQHAAERAVTWSPSDIPASARAPSSLVDEDGLPEFDERAGASWVYPNNVPVRDYQRNIVRKALFQNTMVCLPTGLGKTFIAAVVMYNFYRWYPSGKVVFMAPTRPLVAQQMEACFGITGIPQVDTVMITGAQISPQSRPHVWQQKRVFFLTPQVTEMILGGSQTCSCANALGNRSFKTTCTAVHAQHNASSALSLTRPTVRSVMLPTVKL